MNKITSGLVMALAWILAVAMATTVMATPYASGIQLNGASSTFILNEGDANVSIVYNGGATVVDMGTLAAGTHTFNANLGSSWQIVCSKSTLAGWTQISDDNLAENQYFSPMGVAVNRNSNSSNFGRIYVTNSLAGAITAVPNGRFTDIGLFVMGADQSDILDQLGIPESGGIGWGAASRNSPFKISIAPDDSIYISDYSDSHPGVWRSNADPQMNFDEILDNFGQEASGLCFNHGNVTSIWVEGTGANTVLYTLDEDWPDASTSYPYAEGRGDILRYDIGTSTVYSYSPIIQVDDNTPSPGGVILNGLMDFVRDKDGTWWISQFRSTDTKEVPSLTHWEDGATGPMWTSGRDPRDAGDFDYDTDVDGRDFLIWQRNYGTTTGATVWLGDADGDIDVDSDDLIIWQDNFGNLPQEGLFEVDEAYGSIDIHNDKDLLIMGGRLSYGVYMIDISDPGNPVITDIIPQEGYTRDVAFDIAGNAYIVSSTSETLRIWSPGGSWIATTGSDGSFTLVEAGSSSGTTIPEPSSILLGLAGLIFLGCCRRGVIR